MFDQDVEKDLFQGKESASLGKSTVRTRCPECFKLFAINANEVKENKPKFACTACDTQFWLPFPAAIEADDIVMGFPLNISDDTEFIEGPAVTEDVLDCPKCQSPYSVKDVECKACGIIFSKYYARLGLKKSTLSAPKEVRAAWDKTVDDYDNFQFHQSFISLAQKYQAIDYAFDQYEKVLEVNPADEHALKAQNQLSCLAVTMAETKISMAKPKRDFPKLRLVSFLYFLSAMIIVMGIFFPQMRNLVGFGSAILFLTLALRFYFRIL